MNSNQPASSPSASDETILKKLQSYRWKVRVLTGLALSVGFLSIVAGMVIAWANAVMVMPMERLLLKDYPNAMERTDTNSMAAQPLAAKPELPRAQLDWRHVQVTAAHGKGIFLTAVSIALLGVGTLLTLLLVIFNRHVTLRQINANLAQISSEIKQLAQRQKN